MVIHLFDYEENLKVPSWNLSKAEGYKVAICGYQRKNVTCKKEEVT